MNARRFSLRVPLCLSAALLLFSVASSQAQSQPQTQSQPQQPPAAEQAAAYFQAQDWAKAAEAYAAIVAAEPDDSLSWYRLGVATYNLKKFADAAAAWQHADSLGFAPPLTRYNLAAAYALLDEKDRAFDALTRAVSAGFGNARQLRSDSDFASLRSDTRFDELLNRIKGPCERNAAYRKLDFWLGDWDVFAPDEKLRYGSNRIEKALEGCAIFENWTDATGSAGKSLFYFDLATRNWKQVWVTDTGGMKEKTLVEQLDDGSLRFQGIVTLPNGRTIHDRTTLTPLGLNRVRQLIETSADGNTWQTAFDAIYIRKNPENSVR